MFRSMMAVLVLILISVLSVLLLMKPVNGDGRTMGQILANPAPVSVNPAPVVVKKFLLIYKEGDVYKTAGVLFDSVADLTKAVPPTAAEVRIITVRMD